MFGKLTNIFTVYKMYFNNIMLDNYAPFKVITSADCDTRVDI